MKDSEVKFKVNPLDMATETPTGLTMKVEACEQGVVVSYFSKRGEEIARAGIEINNGQVSGYLVEGFADIGGDRKIDISEYIEEVIRP